MNQFPLYPGPRVKTWTWRDIKKALVGNTEQDIKRIEGRYLLNDDDLRMQGPPNLEWHISGTNLMNNYLWSGMGTAKPWWRHYEETDAYRRGCLQEATNCAMEEFSKEDTNNAK